MTGISDYMYMYMYICAYKYFLCQAVQAMLHSLTLFICLHLIVKWQQKLGLFFTQKRMAVEPENMICR